MGWGWGGVRWGGGWGGWFLSPLWGYSNGLVRSFVRPSILPSVTYLLWCFMDLKKIDRRDCISLNMHIIGPLVILSTFTFLVSFFSCDQAAL